MHDTMLDGNVIYNLTRDIDTLQMQYASERMKNEALTKSMTGLKIFCAFNLLATVVLGVELFLFEKQQEEEVN